MVEQKDLLTAEDRRTLLLHLHNHLEQQLALGETRAGLTLAAGGAFGAVLVTAATASNLLSHLSSREMILFEISALLLCIAMILAFWSVRPAWEVTRICSLVSFPSII